MMEAAAAKMDSSPAAAASAAPDQQLPAGRADQQRKRKRLNAVLDKISSHVISGRKISPAVDTTTTTSNTTTSKLGKANADLLIQQQLQPGWAPVSGSSAADGLATKSKKKCHSTTVSTIADGELTLHNLRISISWTWIKTKI